MLNRRRRDRSSSGTIAAGLALYALSASTALAGSVATETQGAVHNQHNAMLESLLVQAGSGDAEASFHLGVYYLTHSATASDLKLAEVHLRRAAEGEHAAAQHQLGLILVVDEISEERHYEGLYWLGAATSGGDAGAAVILGRLHEHGLYGVSQNTCAA
ncbi:MAG: hypothetical protein AAF334_02785, partial [Pseudomonadota bacterium]